MTTIAYKDGILATDTQVVSSSGAITGQVNKTVINEKSGIMAGATGELVNAALFLNWVLDGAKAEKFPKMSDDFKGIMILRNGDIFFVGDNGLSLPVDGPFFAIGSGEEVAKGALAAGATAAGAVQAAINLDIYSGGSVKVLSFH